MIMSMVFFDASKQYANIVIEFFLVFLSISRSLIRTIMHFKSAINRKNNSKLAISLFRHFKDMLKVLNIRKEEERKKRVKRNHKVQYY